MEEFERQGGISFIIVHYTALDEMYYVPFTDVNSGTAWKQVQKKFYLR